MLRPFSERVVVVDQEVRDTSLEERVDIALYDTFGRDDSVLTSLAEVLASAQASKGVLFTWANDPKFVEAALRAGAAGVISKTVDADALVDALERIHQGETVVSPAPDPSLDVPRPGSGRGDWPGSGYGLTQRESEMLVMITAGHTNAEIAKAAYLSPNSVKSYIRSAYRKIGVVRRSQAVAWGIEHGMRN